MNDELEKPNNGAGIALALVLVFVSGFVALIYQVLWMKQLGLLFGNTSHAASATLASFRPVSWSKQIPKQGHR